MEVRIRKPTFSNDEVNILRLFLLMEEDFIILSIKKIVALCCEKEKMPQTGRAIYAKYGELIGVLRFAAQKVFAVLDLPPPEYDVFISEHEELRGIIFLAAVVREKLEKFLAFRPLPLMLRRPLAISQKRARKAGETVAASRDRKNGRHGELINILRNVLSNPVVVSDILSAAEVNVLKIWLKWNFDELSIFHNSGMSLRVFCIIRDEALAKLRREYKGIAL